MRQTLRALALAATLLPGMAWGQVPQFPQNLPAKTVVGRLGATPGPSQAIPFNTLLGILGSTQPANTFYAGPSSGGAASTAFRHLVGADLPAPGASSLGGVQSLTCSSHTWFNTLSTAGVLGCSQPTYTDIGGGFPTPGASALGGVQSKDCSGGGQFLQKINTDGTETCASPAGGSVVPNNYLSGLTISNDATSDITNEIAVQAGIAMDTTNATMMVLASALTRKSLNAAWAVGSTAGCRDTGAISNATWFVFLIERTDLTNVDTLCSLSPSAPTMPANYTLKRRIGAIIRASAAIVLFIQDGNHFSLNTPAQEINGVDPGATSAITRTLTGVPIGIRVRADLQHGNNSDISVAVWLTDLAVADVTPLSTSNNLFTLASTTSSVPASVFTNASGQVRSRHSARDAGTLYFLITKGWDDARGQ